VRTVSYNRPRARRSTDGFKTGLLGLTDAVPPTYDLSDLAETLSEGSTRAHWTRDFVVMGIFLFYAVTFAYVIAAEALAGHFYTLGGAELPALGLVASLTSLSFWGAFTHSRQAASEVDIGPDGIAFHYATGDVAELAWSDPKFHLVIRQKGSDVMGQPVRYCRLWTRPTVFLTEEATESLAVAAHAVGLAVDWHTDPGSAGLELVKIHPPHPGLADHGRLSMTATRPFASARAAGALGRRR
jgi:hypothetical protein